MCHYYIGVCVNFFSIENLNISVYIHAMDWCRLPIYTYMRNTGTYRFSTYDLRQPPITPSLVSDINRNFNFFFSRSL